MTDWIHCNRCMCQPHTTPDKQFVITNCGHVFCEVCAPAGGQGQCPVCKAMCTCGHLGRNMKPDVEIFFLAPSEIMKRHNRELAKLSERNNSEVAKLQEKHNSEVVTVLERLNSEAARVLSFQQRHKDRFLDCLGKKLKKFESNYSQLETLVQRHQQMTKENQRLREEIKYLKRLVENSVAAPSVRSSPHLYGTNSESTYSRQPLGRRVSPFQVPISADDHRMPMQTNAVTSGRVLMRKSPGNMLSPMQIAPTSIPITPKPININNPFFTSRHR